MSAPWRGEVITVHGRKFGKKAQRWLFEALQYRIASCKGCFDGRIDPAFIEPLTMWYGEHAEQVLAWVPYESYTGMSGTTGSWRLDEKAFVRLFADAVEAVKYPSLDAWLDAERRGKLTGKGVTGGSEKLSASQRGQLSIAYWKRRDHWPRNCRKCGETFRPVKTGNVHCAVCRQAKQAPTSPVRPAATPSRKKASCRTSKAAPVEHRTKLPVVLPVPARYANEHPDFIKGYRDGLEQLLKGLRDEFGIPE